MDDYMFHVFYDDKNTSADFSQSDLTIDEFNYLRFKYSDNISIKKTHTVLGQGHIVILKNIDIHKNPILHSICDKARHWPIIDNENCPIVIKQNKLCEIINERELLCFERILPMTNDSIKSIDYNIETMTYKNALDKIYKNNLNTLSRLIKYYELTKNDKVFRIIKYIIDISDPCSLKKLNIMNSKESTCVIAYDRNANSVSKLTHCFYSSKSSLTGNDDIINKKILYETKCTCNILKDYFECFGASGLTKNNIFFDAIVQNNLKFILDFINIYIDSLESLSLAKLCGHKNIHNLLISACNINNLKTNKFYNFYEKMELNDG